MSVRSLFLGLVVPNISFQKLPRILAILGGSLSAMWVDGLMTTILSLYDGEKVLALIFAKLDGGMSVGGGRRDSRFLILVFRAFIYLLISLRHPLCLFGWGQILSQISKWTVEW